MPPQPCPAETRASTFSPPWTWPLSRASSSWVASSGKRSGASSFTKARFRAFPPCRDGSRPQIDVSRRLQLGDAHDAAFLGDDKSRREILQHDVLRLHGVAAGIERQRRL